MSISKRPDQLSTISPRMAQLLLIVPPFLGGVDLTLFNSVAHALPVLDHAWTLWFIDSYSIMLAAGVVGASRLGARFGPGRVLSGGLLVFAGCSVTPALVPNAEMWTLARCGQGLGYALMVSSVVSCIGTLFEGASRQRVYSWWAVAASLGAGLGPLLGKAALVHGHAEALFWVPATVAVFAALPTWSLLHDLRLGRAAATRLDVFSCVLAFLGFTGVVGALQLQAGLAYRLCALGAGSAILVAFARRQLRSDDPLLDIGMLRFVHLGGASLVLVCLYGCYAGAVYLFGATGGTWTAIFAVSALAGWVAIGGALLARVPTYWSAIRVLRGCVVMSAAGFFLAALLGVWVGGVLIGLAAGLGTPAAGAVMVSRSGQAGVARAGALQETGFGLGAALGVASLGALLGGTESVGVTCCVVGAALMLVSITIGKSTALKDPI